MKRAFTLIELLVVIAIIAILAAILFPVFAQAKVAAKKTADLSNVKQLALATPMYETDNDDILPMQSGRQCGGANAGWDFNSRILVPATWSVSANADYAAGGGGNCNRVSGGMYAAPNVVQPYVKSIGLYTMPGAPQQSGAVTPVPGDGQYALVSYNYNGLLSSYSSTSVADPAGTPDWWPAFGQVARIGDTYADPFLVCSDPTSACIFSGGGQVFSDATSCGAAVANGDSTPNGTESAFGNIHYTSFCFNKTENWAFTDGHAKSRQMGTGDQNLDPYPIDGYNASGVPDSMPGYTGYEGVYDQNCHAPLFRPDTMHKVN